jgi:hypothetical protein
MKNVRTAWLWASLLILSAPAFAEAEWKTSTTGDGLITVRSRISERSNEAGKKVMLIEYSATTKARMKLADGVALLKNVERHKLFLDEKVSDRVKTVSDREWVVYYTFGAPWPMPSSDCVAVMTQEDSAQKTVFSLTAAPSLVENRKLDRMRFYNVTYAFRDLGDGLVEITTAASVSPLVQVPDWMVAGFFPDGPAKVLNRIVKLAQNPLLTSL